MIKSKTLARKLLKETDRGTDPKHLIKALMEGPSARAFDTRFLENLIYHLHAGTERRERDGSLVIATARSVDQSIVEHIRKFTGAPADAPIAAKVDDSLIGGFTAQYKGTRYDASVKSQLVALERKLSN